MTRTELEHSVQFALLSPDLRARLLKFVHRCPAAFFAPIQALLQTQANQVQDLIRSSNTLQEMEVAIAALTKDSTRLFQGYVQNEESKQSDLDLNTALNGL